MATKFIVTVNMTKSWISSQQGVTFCNAIGLRKELQKAGYQKTGFGHAEVKPAAFVHTSRPCSFLQAGCCELFLLRDSCITALMISSPDRQKNKYTYTGVYIYAFCFSSTKEIAHPVAHRSAKISPMTVRLTYRLFLFGFTGHLPLMSLSN